MGDSVEIGAEFLDFYDGYDTVSAEAHNAWDSMPAKLHDPKSPDYVVLEHGVRTPGEIAQDLVGVRSYDMASVSANSLLVGYLLGRKTTKTDLRNTMRITTKVFNEFEIALRGAEDPNDPKLYSVITAERPDKAHRYIELMQRAVAFEGGAASPRLHSNGLNQSFWKLFVEYDRGLTTTRNIPTTGELL